MDAWLGSLRRRLDRTALGEAFWGSVLAIVAIGLASLLVAAALGPGLGRLAWVPLAGVALGSGIFLWRRWWRPRRARASQEALARWVEERVDDLHSGVITAVQSGAALRTGDTWVGLDPAMATAAATRTGQRLDAVDPDVLVDRRELIQLRRFGLLVAVVGTLAALVGAEVLADGARNLVRPAPPPPAAPPVTEVDVAVGDIAFRLLYPAYLDLQPRDIARSSGDVSAVTGTEVRLTASALLPATAAALVLESDPDGRWPVEVGADGVLSTGFRVGANDRYRFVLHTTDGRRVGETHWRNIEALPDLAPDVRLLIPETDVEVDPSDEVAFVAEVVDDHGLEGAALVVDPLDGKEPQRRPLRSVRGERTARLTASLPVAPLELRPGDTVEVWLEATDLNTVTGPGVGRSARRRISMYSPEAEHEERLRELEGWIEQLLDVLAERLESPIDGRAPARLASYLTVQQGISSQTGAAVKTGESLLAALSTDSMASDTLRDTVLTTVDALRDHFELEASQLRMAFDAVKKLRRMQELTQITYSLNEEGVTELETGILALKDLLDEARKSRLLDEGRELLDAQNDLMELLEQLNDGANEELTREAERMLDDLEQNLRQMQEELRKLAERTPYENQNRQRADPHDNEVDMRSIRDRLAEVRELMRQGKIEEAMKLLEELNRETQEMMAALQDDFGPMSKVASETRKKLGDFNQKQQEIADGQQGLLEETQDAQRQMEARHREQMGQELQEAMQGARDKAKELEEKLAEIEKEPMHPADQEELSELQHKAKELREMVEREDLQQARDDARKMAGQCNQLGGEVGQSEARELDLKKAKSLKASKRSLGEGGQLAEQLAQELDDLMDKLQPRPNGQERKRTGQLQHRQEQLGEQLDKLGEGLQELEQHMPGIGEQLQPMLDEAGQEMKQAGRRLGEGKPGRAAPHQRAAMERLGEARQQMQQRLKESQGSENDGGVGINDPRRRVEIPEEDLRPHDFREELLDAMKERAPERFKEAIERYYEDLVR